MKKIVFTPNAKQEAFFHAQTRYVAYGGARGGGKSWAMRMKLILLALRYEGISILLLRRTLGELRENHILPMTKILDGIAVYKESTKDFLFPNGSRIKLGYCDSESDVLQYQGQAYEVIGMEEATHFTYYQYLCLTECNRISGAMREPFTPRMYFTCNPGGVGNDWVKRLFVDRIYTENEKAEDYTFIKSLVYDNAYLMEHDPQYVRALEALPEKRRQAMLYGDWNAFEGAFFPEFRRETHVVRPFELPGDCVRFRALDYGLDMTACLWLAVMPDKRIVVYREFCRPNLILSEAAKAILSHTPANEKIRYTVASPDLWNRRQETGQSAADIFGANGVTLTKTSNDRLDGWSAVKEWLRVRDDADGAKRARLRIFNTCKNLIRTLQAVQHDEKKINDVATEPHELTHAPDALRHFCVYWTTGAERELTHKPVKWPDDLWEDYYRCDEAGQALMIERFGNPF